MFASTSNMCIKLLLIYLLTTTNPCKRSWTSGGRALLTDEFLGNAERHHDERDAEVGDGQRHEEVVSDALE